MEVANCHNYGKLVTTGKVDLQFGGIAGYVKEKGMILNSYYLERCNGSEIAFTSEEGSAKSKESFLSDEMRGCRNITQVYY